MQCLHNIEFKLSISISIGHLHQYRAGSGKFEVVFAITCSPYKELHVTGKCDLVIHFDTTKIK